MTKPETTKQEMIDPQDMPFLPVDNGNKLRSAGEKPYQRHGFDGEDYHYDEVTPDGEVVAQYRVWDHMRIYPPRKTHRGWEKRDLEGNVIDRKTDIPCEKP